MAYNYFTNPEGDDAIVDLDAIIEQLGQLESQLSYRETVESQVTANAARIAEKSRELDHQLNSVLQELSNLESENGEHAQQNDSGEQLSMESGNNVTALQGIHHYNDMTFDDLSPSPNHSEKKNFHGTLSRQSSHSSCTSSGSIKSTQSLVRVYSPDGTSKTIAVDERTTVDKLCQVLAKKHRITMPLNWAIVESLPALYMERILEDHLLVMDQVNLWTKDSKNRLIFMERPEKYSMFNDEEVKGAAANNSYSPSVEGLLHLKIDEKKVWKKLYVVLRASGFYYNPKGKAKAAASDLICLQPLKGIELFFGLDWKKNYKALTEFGFALKLPMIQKEVPKCIHFFCLEDKKSFMDWVTAFRLVKYGRQLYDNYAQSLTWTTAHSRDLSARAKSQKSEHSELEQHTQCSNTVPDVESESHVSHARKNSSDYGTLKKSVPNLPITTSLTRHLSIQQQNYARTLPKKGGQVMTRGFQEDDLTSLPSKDGHFLRFPSPDFSLDQQQSIENGNVNVDMMATLPKRNANNRALCNVSLLERSHTIHSNSKTASTHQVKLHSEDRSPNAQSSSSKNTASCSAVHGIPKSFSSDSISNNYGFLEPDRLCYEDLPLPPPPSLDSGYLATAKIDNISLPPPPPPLELLFMGNSHQQQPNCKGANVRHLSLTGMPSSPPPPPPIRSSGTKLSLPSKHPHTEHIIKDLDRVQIQKQTQGADGLANLEIPLPPPPSYDDDSYFEDVDPFDLPPPPAEILESLKMMRNRPLPPLPTNLPPFHRPMFSKVI